MERKNTSQLMTMLGLTESMEIAAKANELSCYKHMLRTEDNPVKMTVNLKLGGKWRIGRLKSTWKEKVKDS